jgi:light-regulated signal transduction histidine kinase (bacteriophytochrome)
MLIEDYAAQLPAKGRELLNAVMAAGEHMERLTTGLLRLSQLSRQPLSKRLIDMASLIREVLDELTRVHAGPSVAVHAGDLPNAVGDQALLKQVMTNLLTNAFKFTRTRDKPTIEVAAQRAMGENIYTVRDNGVGFDMQAADKLFDAFQRFHTAEQYEGTGIGLSIAARIIQRHGGRIWADAEVDKGATFYFSLPD